VSVAATAGAKSFAVSFSRCLLVGVVQRLDTGRLIDEALVEEALRAGKDADIAGSAFESRLLARIGGSAVLPSAVAEVVIETARELMACLRGEIDFDELCRRTLLAILSAGGAIGGLALVSRLTRLLTGFAAWGGAYLGRELGERLLQHLGQHGPNLNRANV
jgi:hypothetical protein